MILWTCPFCLRPARTACLGGLSLYDCQHCSHYRIEEEAIHSLFADPLPPREVANIAAYNWQWPVDAPFNAVNIRAIGRLRRESDHHLFFQCLLRVLYNTYEQRLFTLRFDNPMLLGVSGSASPSDLRDLVKHNSFFLPFYRDLGTKIQTFVSDDAVSIMSIPVLVAPGISAAVDLEGFRSNRAA